MSCCKHKPCVDGICQPAGCRALCCHPALFRRVLLYLMTAGMQEAAGFFQYLSLSLGSQLSGAPSVDVTPDCTEMLLLLSLAQAQECYFVKAQTDRKSRATLAR